jgi:hypothetical protein
MHIVHYDTCTYLVMTWYNHFTMFLRLNRIFHPKKKPSNARNVIAIVNVCGLWYQQCYMNKESPITVAR